ncbi:MAG TPA: GNAT family N-acetyltransferase [Burkholderiaceae bacterium]|nr:GNAT family N-acetyltransferase [Burkholderiaceae bacterium]
MTDNIHVTHDPARQRFEALVDGQLSVADYHLRDGVMHMTHTGVPPSLRGRGIAAALVQEALAHAEREGLKVNPLCSYVRTYMERHPETRKLLAA